MSLLRAVVWCLVVLLIIVPTVRLAPSAGDQVSHHGSMKASRALSGVGRTTAATPSGVERLPILTPRSLDMPGARSLTLSADPTIPFVPPRG